MACRRFDPTLEKQATFLAGQLLVPDTGRSREEGGFRRMDQQVAAKFSVSTQFAQMRSVRSPGDGETCPAEAGGQPRLTQTKIIGQTL